MIKEFFALVKEKTLRGLLVNLGLILLVAFVFVIIFFFGYLPGATHHGETVTVPNLEGMPLTDMTDFLGKRDFRYEVSDSGYSSVYPPLTILKQYPKPGAYVKENRKIYLTVKAKEPQKVKMPDLIDGSLKNAELVLKSYGLQRGQLKYKPDLAANAVLEQWYDGAPVKPGTPVPKGSSIDLVVGDGLGNRIFNVPDFLGLGLEEADFSIIGSGLRTGSVIVRVVNPQQKASLVQKARELGIDTVTIAQSGHVFRQSPEVGTEIRLGEQMDLWVVSDDRQDSARIVEEWRRKGAQAPDDPNNEQ